VANAVGITALLMPRSRVRFPPVLQWVSALAHCSTVAQSGRARIHFNNFVAAGDQKYQLSVLLKKKEEK
jgi:hypothetical protein